MAADARGPLDRRLFALAPALRTHLVVATAVACATAIALLAQAEVLARGLPRLVGGDTTPVAGMAAGLLAVAGLRAAGGWAIERSSTRALVATRRAVRREVLAKVGAASGSDDARVDPARATTLVTTGMDALEPWIRAYLPALVVAAIVPVAVGIRILTADFVSAAILVVTIPLIPVFMVLIGRMTQERTTRQWSVLGRLAHHFHDVLLGMATLRLFGRGSAQVERVREVSEQYRRSTVATLRIAFLSALALELLATLSVAIVAVSLGVRLASGGIGFTAALVVLLLAPECALPLRRVGASFHAAINGLDAANDVFATLAVPTPVAGIRTADEVHDATVTVRRVGVTATRGTRLVPTDLTARPGELVAVVGPSGGGKSTLLDVIRGALDPTAGVVAIGGVTVTELTYEARQDLVAWVPAHPNALGTTVWDSVLLGVDRNGPRSGLAAYAAIDEIGLGALTERDPASLSGGERQRVAVARAVTRVRAGHARVLIADEPTAHLDERAAGAVIRQLVMVARAGTTVIVATHDHALRSRADRVLHIRGPGSAALDRASVIDVPPDTATAPRPSLAATLPDLGVATTSSRGSSSDDATGSLRWAWSLTRGRRAQLFGGFGLGAAADICAVGLVGVAAWLVMRAAEQPPFSALAVAAVLVRTFGIGKGVFRYVERLVAHDATLRVLADTRATVIGAMARIAPAGLPRASRGDLMSGLVDDVDRMQDLCLRIVGPAFAAAVTAVIAIAVTTLLAPVAGLVLLVAAVVVAIAVPTVIARRVGGEADDVAAARAAMTASVLDYAEHAREYDAHGAGVGVRREIDARASMLDALDHRRTRVLATAAAIVAAAPTIVVAITLLALQRDIGTVAGPVLGVLILWPLATVELFGTLAPIGSLIVTVKASAARVQAIVATPSPVPETAHAVPLASVRRAQVHDASLRWPGSLDLAVAHASLDVTRGSTVVLRGPSGSGKSTIAAALVRFIELDEGRYALDDIDATTAASDDVRAHVTWAMQEPWIANTSIRENLRLGAPGVDDFVLLDALAVVGLGAWALALPDGLDTLVGIDGTALSSGQRQRLALARTLLADHEVVVLDEPTAHLDAETADRVMRGVLDELIDRAVVVITHDAERDEVGPERPRDRVRRGVRRDGAKDQ